MPKIEVDLPELPEGFSYTGEYRYPKKGEYYLDLCGLARGPLSDDCGDLYVHSRLCAAQASLDWTSTYMCILKKRKKVTKEVLVHDTHVSPHSGWTSDCGDLYVHSCSTGYRIKAYRDVTTWEDE